MGCRLGLGGKRGKGKGEKGKGNGERGTGNGEWEERLTWVGAEFLLRQRLGWIPQDSVPDPRNRQGVVEDGGAPERKGPAARWATGLSA